MYLKGGREIYESDKYPGYFIDANTGAFCDEEGNYIGGNIDNGDKPGGGRPKERYTVIDVPDYVYITKTGKMYYPAKTKSATIRMRLEDADEKGYKPSPGYTKFVTKLYKKQLREHNKKKK